MDDAHFGRVIRALRLERRWRVVDLAGRARVSMSTVANVETGRLGRMKVSTLRAVVAPFGATYEGVLFGLGAEVDRILDKRHARLLGACANWLSSLGWEIRTEISYSEFGERGSIDLLAWHAPTRTLLVIEIKSELASIEATVRKLDEKARLGPRIARRLGWEPAVVSRLVVLPDDRTQRRRVAAYGSVLDPAFPVRTRQVRAWCAVPSGSIAGLMFLPEPNSSDRARRVRRVRIQSARLNRR
ncbi:MAG: helix-turn-helix domain-containing protein [Candidatus Limnocylindrales bacterium]